MCARPISSSCALRRVCTRELTHRKWLAAGDLNFLWPIVDDEVESYILSDLFEYATIPMEQRSRKLSETVLVHCAAVRVLIERLFAGKT